MWVCFNACAAVTSPKMAVFQGDFSESVPFLKQPTNLDGSLPGDVGFDPLGFSEVFDVKVLREAELKHGRIAMLAVLGWTVQETAPASIHPGFPTVSFLPPVFPHPCSRRLYPFSWADVCSCVQQSGVCRDTTGRLRAGIVSVFQTRNMSHVEAGRTFAALLQNTPLIAAQLARSCSLFLFSPGLPRSSGLTNVWCV